MINNLPKKKKREERIELDKTTMLKKMNFRKKKKIVHQTYFIIFDEIISMHCRECTSNKKLRIETGKKKTL